MTFLIIAWKKFLRFWKAVGEFNSRVILAVVYFLGIGISAIVAKSFKKRFLELKQESGVKSYWTKREKQIKPEDFRRSF